MRRALVVVALLGCGDDGSMTTADAPTTAGQLTIDNCATAIDSDVPAPYATLFRCVTMSIEGTDLVITSTALPPHESYYYGAGNANYVAWDDRGGAYHPNPNTLTKSSTTIVVPLTPTSRNLTITTALVDGVNGTSGSEYRGGPVGIALDSVLLFNALAAPGDDIAQEQYTFDPYNAHPAPGGQYHYHRDSSGPLEVLARAGTPSIQAYGLMCDGTFVLGCTELDGPAPSTTDLDAQNGHTHDMPSLGPRYHIHICPMWTDHPRPYTPEIQFYNRCTIR
jgi:hypothetical protein